MSKFDESVILRLPEEATIAPFDTGAQEQQYILTVTDGRHFRLTSRLRQFVECIDGQRNLTEIAALLEEKWQQPVHPQQVWQIAQKYLGTNGLLLNFETSFSNHHHNQAKDVFLWHVELFSPQSISPLTRIGQVLFRPPFFLVSLGLIATTCLSIYWHTEDLWSHWTDALVGSNFLLIYSLIVLSVFIHEIGHASACRYFDKQYGVIGLGIYLIFPVFYADVTQIWSLNRRQRLVVNLGGIYFQMLTGVVYYALYLITNNQIFLLANVGIGLLVLFTFNPIVKFDGYWLVSDFLGVPNLHRRLGEMIRRSGSNVSRSVPLKPQVQVGLWLYLFLFAILITTIAVFTVPQLPIIWNQLATTLTENGLNALYAWQSGHWQIVGASLLRMLSPSVILVAFVLILFRMLNRVLKPNIVRLKK